MSKHNNRRGEENSEEKTEQLQKLTWWSPWKKSPIQNKDLLTYETHFQPLTITSFGMFFFLHLAFLRGLAT